MRRLIVAIVVFGCSLATQAQTANDAELNKRVDALAQKLLARPVVGISVAIARNGHVIFARGYGMANLQHSVAVTPETVFHIDSISKNIFVFFHRPCSLMCEQGTAPLTSNLYRTLNALRG